MKTSVTSSSPSEVPADWLVALICESETIAANLESLDRSLSGVVAATLERKDFTGKALEVLPLYQASGIAATNVLLVGIGKIEDCEIRGLRHSLLAGLRNCCTQPDQSVAVVVDERVTPKVSTTTLAELFGDSTASAHVDADICKSERSRHPFASVSLCLETETPLAPAIDAGVVIGQACNLVKEFVNRPANDLYPISFADAANEAIAELGVDVTVLDEKQIADERMGALLGVAQGSDQPARVVRLSWDGPNSSGPQLALVGKGVTFDTGGYSIKSTSGMLPMKADMGGAATALGAIVAAARLKLPVRLTVYLGLVENMISGKAYRLGDVLTARNGTSIEIHNTDAEGRLVLADILSYAVDDGADRIVDLATLTGACVVALGEDITGMFAGNDELARELQTAADSAGEYFWSMPMHKHFDSQLKSTVADCKNVGPRWGGAITAAKFLQKFVSDVPWVHLDIAGPSWADTSSAWQDAGGTGSPVRTLIEWLRHQ